MTIQRNYIDVSIFDLHGFLFLQKKKQSDKKERENPSPSLYTCFLMFT